MMTPRANGGGQGNALVPVHLPRFGALEEIKSQYRILRTRSTNIAVSSSERRSKRRYYVRLAARLLWHRRENQYCHNRTNREPARRTAFRSKEIIGANIKRRPLRRPPAALYAARAITRNPRECSLIIR